MKPRATTAAHKARLFGSHVTVTYLESSPTASQRVGSISICKTMIIWSRSNLNGVLQCSKTRRRKWPHNIAHTAVLQMTLNLLIGMFPPEQEDAIRRKLVSGREEATLIEASLGLGKGLVYLSSRNDEDLLAQLQTNRELRIRVEATLARQLEVARRIVGAQHEAIQHLAERLMDQPLSGDEVREILLRQPRLRLITETTRAESKDALARKVS
jgi:hypothetical protein